MFDLEEMLSPWLEQLTGPLGPVELFDAHTHLGENDPDGFKQRADQLLAHLAAIDARAVVFPSAEPAGYAPANEEVLRTSHDSDGRLVAFCRVDPNTGPAAVAEARRCLDAGARGIKLHPRAERFTMHHPTVRDIVALAHERKAPVLIHAGRGIPALGEDTVRLSDEFGSAPLILAHAAISDIAWLWRVLSDHPNVFIDTAWWNPVDVVALFLLAPPGQILWGSDAPYGRPITSLVQALRVARQAGLSPDAMRSVAGGQMARLLEGSEPLDLGPPPGPPYPQLHPLLQRVVVHLSCALSRAIGGGDSGEPLGLARLACAVEIEGPHAEVFSAVLELLDLFERHAAPPDPGQRLPAAFRLVTLALFVASTPDAPLGPLPEYPEPSREEAEPEAAV